MPFHPVFTKHDSLNSAIGFGTYCTSVRNTCLWHKLMKLKIRLFLRPCIFICIHSVLKIRFISVYIALTPSLFLQISALISPQGCSVCLFQRLRLRKKGNTETKLGQLGNEVHMVHLTLMHWVSQPQRKA